MKNCWEVLCIAPTASKKEIKTAYSELVKKYHPEDDPVAYQEVRQAYEEAMYSFHNHESLYILTRHQNNEQVNIANNDKQKTTVNDLLNTSYQATSKDFTIKEESDPLHQKESTNTRILTENIIWEMDKSQQEFIANSSFSFEDIQWRMDELRQETKNLYASDRVNDTTCWDALFAYHKDHEELILEALMEEDLSRFDDERITFYFEDIITKLPREDKTIYEELLNKIKRHHEAIRKQVQGYQWKSAVDTIGIILMIITFLFNVVCLLYFGYRSFFISNDTTLFDIVFFVESYIFIYQLFYIISRSTSRKQQFIIRDKRLIWSVLFTIFTSITYSISGFMMLSWIHVSYAILAVLAFDIGIVFLYMRKDYFLDAYERSKIGINAYSCMALCFLFEVLVLFVIFIVLLKTSENTQYIYALIFTLMMLYMQVAILSRFVDDMHKHMSQKIQQYAFTVICIGSLCGSNFLIHMVQEPPLRSQPFAHTVCGLILCITFIIAFILSRISKRQYKKYFRNIFTLPCSEFVSELFDFISIKCDNGKHLNVLTPYETAFYLVQCFDREIKQHGFYYFLSNAMGDDYFQILDSLKMMVAPLAIERLTTIAQIFPNGEVPIDVDVRNAALDMLWNSNLKMMFSRLDQEHMKQNDENLETMSYAFVMNNKTRFPYRKS